MQSIINEDLQQTLDSSSSLTIADLVQKMIDLQWLVYISGGAPRDWLLGLNANDIDLSVSVDVNTIQEFCTSVLPSCKMSVNENFGIVNLEGDNYKLDINIIRTYADIENELDEMTFKVSESLNKDIYIRDFTINALYYDCKNCEILDPSGFGLADLENKVLRLIMEPKKLSVDYRIGIRILQFMARGYTAMPESLEILTKKFKQHVADFDGFEFWLGIYIQPNKAYYNKFKELAISYCCQQTKQKLLLMFNKMEM